MEGKIEYGMNYEQVRASIGNPDIINNTSSRHGVSQQWIYGKNLSNKRYLFLKMVDCHPCKAKKFYEKINFPNFTSVIILISSTG